jgi:hypothetical protein
MTHPVSVSSIFRVNSSDPPQKRHFLTESV